MARLEVTSASRYAALRLFVTSLSHSFAVVGFVSSDDVPYIILL